MLDCIGRGNPELDLALEKLNSLSEQELKVFLGLARGEPIKEISCALGVGEKTVRTYRTRLFEKLQLKSGTDLIRFAMLHELID